MEKEKNTHTSEELWRQKSQSKQKEKPKGTINHGYVSLDQSHKEVIVPPGQLALGDLSKTNENFDVGPKTYLFQGDAREIVDFLDQNKEMTFSAHTLGQDGNWGIGKDPEHANLTMSVSTPQPDGPKTHGELCLDSAKKFMKATVGLGVGETVQFAIEVTNATDALHNFQSTYGFTNPEQSNDTDLSLGQAIRDKNAEGLRTNDAINIIGNDVTGQAKGSPVMNPNGLSGKIQRAKNTLQKGAKKMGVEKMPVIGEKINQVIVKAVGKKISISINPYHNARQPGVAHINLGKPTVTFGEIAQQIREKVLAEKQGKTNQEEISCDTEKQATNLQEQTAETNTEKTEIKDKNQKSSATQSKEDKIVESAQTEIKSYPLEKMGSAQNTSPEIEKSKSMGHQSMKTIKKTKKPPSKIRL